MNNHVIYNFFQTFITLHHFSVYASIRVKQIDRVFINYSWMKCGRWNLFFHSFLSISRLRIMSNLLLCISVVYQYVYSHFTLYSICSTSGQCCPLNCCIPSVSFEGHFFATDVTLDFLLVLNSSVILLFRKIGFFSDRCSRETVNRIIHTFWFISSHTDFISVPFSNVTC